MRVRWMRVAAAGTALFWGLPAASCAVMWVTTPAPSPIERAAPGPDDCSTNEVLEAGIALHTAHGPGPQEVDRLAADVLLQAARCARVEEIEGSRQWDVFRMTQHGVAWIDANEDGEVALDHALDVWELVADQRRVGPAVNAAVWNALGEDGLPELVERHLYTVSADARAEAARRLVRIATAPLDWDEVLVREERSVRAVIVEIVTEEPSQLAWLPFAPRELLRARRGTHPIVAQVQQEVRLSRVEAAVIAGAATLAGVPEDGGTGCADSVPVADELEAVGIRLTVDPDLCVVAGVSGEGVRMASPWTGLLNTLRDP